MELNIKPFYIFTTEVKKLVFDTYQKLSGRKLSMGKEMEVIRALRHSIVHDAYRISFSQSLQTQRFIDTGRWVFSWLENQPARMEVREKLIGKRSLGNYFRIFSTEITPAGVIMHKPTLPPSK